MTSSAVDEESLRLHALCRGTTQALPKCPVRGIDDVAVWYTPGVTAPSQVIARDPEAAWTYTNRANTVAIVADGTRVLGLDPAPSSSRTLRSRSASASWTTCGRVSRSRSGTTISRAAPPRC